MLVTFRFSVAAFTPTFARDDRSNSTSAFCSFVFFARADRGSAVPKFVEGKVASRYVSPPRACASVDDFCTAFFSRARPNSATPRSRAKLIRQSTQVFTPSHRSKTRCSSFFHSSGLPTTQSGLSGDTKTFGSFPRETPVAKYRCTCCQGIRVPALFVKRRLFHPGNETCNLGTI